MISRVASQMMSLDLTEADRVQQLLNSVSDEQWLDVSQFSD